MVYDNYEDGNEIDFRNNKLQKPNKLAPYWKVRQLRGKISGRGSSALRAEDLLVKIEVILNLSLNPSIIQSKKKKKRKKEKKEKEKEKEAGAGHCSKQKQYPCILKMFKLNQQYL